MTITYDDIDELSKDPILREAIALRTTIECQRPPHFDQNFSIGTITDNDKKVVVAIDQYGTVIRFNEWGGLILYPC